MKCLAYNDAERDEHHLVAMRPQCQEKKINSPKSFIANSDAMLWSKLSISDTIELVIITSSIYIRTYKVQAANLYMNRQVSDFEALKPNSSNLLLNLEN